VSLGAASANEERLPLEFETAQAADDLLYAEIVTPAHTRGEGIETRHLATAQPRLFGLRASPERLDKGGLRRTSVVEIEGAGDVKEGSSLVPQCQDLPVTVKVVSHEFSSPVEPSSWADGSLDDVGRILSCCSAAGLDCTAMMRDRSCSDGEWQMRIGHILPWVLAITHDRTVPVSSEVMVLLPRVVAANFAAASADRVCE
jgi:hypothetical protein